MAKERSKIVFFKRKQQHKTRSYPIKQDGDSYKDPLQHLDPNNEELYPKTLEMVDYLNHIHY